MTAGMRTLERDGIEDGVETALVALDRVTRERLAVAEVAADTLERLTDSGALTALDPTVAAHLVDHARALAAWLQDLRTQPAVHSEESSQLAVRRLERRLQVVLELLDEAEEESARESAAFAGDFADERRAAARRRRGGTAGSRAPASGAAGRTSLRARWQARRQATQRQLRLVKVASIGAVVALAAVAWNGLTAASTPPPRRVAAPGGMEPGAYLEDMRLFMPVTATMLNRDGLSVMVEKSWLVEPVSKRQQDALEAHTYLLNRNVRRLFLRWSDGRMIASFESEAMSWHETLGDDGMQPPIPIDWH